MEVPIEMRLVSSYINGLDEILERGFNRPSIVLVGGMAGTGKTTFCLQSLFNAAKDGKTCLYISAISEPPAVINDFMSGFSFYDSSLFDQGRMHIKLLGDQVLSLGSGEILEGLEKKVREVRPDRVVIDPVSPLGYGVKQYEGREMRRHEQRSFYYEMFSMMKAWNTLVLVTGEFTQPALQESILGYMVDGIIYLAHEEDRGRRSRSIDVIKMRGQNHATGRHCLKIGKEGIRVFPSLKSGEHARDTPGTRVSSGIPGLDGMLNGGLIKDSTNLIVGSAGTGKTTLATQFIVSGSLDGEPGVIVALEESPDQIRRNMASFGWDLTAMEDKGLLKLVSLSPIDLCPGEMAYMIKDACESTGARRIMIDSISGVRSMFTDSSKLITYLQQLAHYLKAREITSIFIYDMPDLMGSSRLTVEGFSEVMDSVVMLRYVEIASEMKKAVSVLKIRGSDHDKEIREFKVGKGGIEVGMAFKEYEGILSGSARKTPREAFVEAFKK
jgi:circadian clock protein KaiC